MAPILERKRVWVRIILLAAMLASTIVTGVNVTVALGAGFSDPHAPTVATDGPMTIPVNGLVPGDHVAASITMRAGDAGRYRVEARASGSRALVSQLRLRITGTGVGETIYDGLLDDYRSADRLLQAGETKDLAISVSLPISSGNDVEGGAVSVRISVTTTPAQG